MFFGIVNRDSVPRPYWIHAYCAEHVMFDCACAAFLAPDKVSLPTIKTTLLQSSVFFVSPFKTEQDVQWIFSYLDALFPAFRNRVFNLIKTTENFSQFISGGCRFDEGIAGFSFCQENDSEFSAFWEKISNQR